MTKEIGCFLGNQIGTLKDIDVGASSDCLRKYLRVRVEVALDVPLKQRLWVELTDQGQDTIMLLRYKRLPKFFFTYGYVGHSFRECPVDVYGNKEGELKPQKFGSWLRASSPTKSRGSASNTRDYGGQAPPRVVDGQIRRQSDNLGRNNRGLNGVNTRDLDIQKIGKDTHGSSNTMDTNLAKD
ncbi:hypothetical protein ACOSQ3_031606 [Xanthoceras sorbifolium]